MSARILFCGAIAAALLTTPASAQLSALWSTCTGRPDVEWEKQIESCTAIIESKQEAPERLAVAYNNRGVARLELKPDGTILPDDRAMADFGEAIKLNPKYADAYYNRGRLWHVNGVYYNAIDLYSFAIGLDPKHVGAYRQRGLAWLLMGGGEPDRAIADFTEAIRLDPKDAGVYLERGYARISKEDLDGAIADFTEAIRLDPKLVDAYRHRGEAWLTRDEFDRAVADYAEAIRLDPNNADHYIKRGYANFFRGDFSASADDLHRAIELKPNDYEEDLALFRYLARTRAGQEARAELEVARKYRLPSAFSLYLGDATPEEILKDVSRRRDRCKAAFYVGQWHLIRGEREEARRHLQSAAVDQCYEAMPHQRAAVLELKRIAPEEVARPRVDERARPDPALSVAPASGKPFRDKLADGKPCPMCPEMVVVPAGSFTMGSPESEPGRERNESPQHTVTFARQFAVGRFALTFDEWDACVADGGCNGYKPPDEGWGRGRRPVVNVDWGDAKDYVAWLSRKTGKNYRLLSEAEREYVTRAGTTTPLWWGRSISMKQANYNGKKTVPVDAFRPNRWGLYQVHGNVAEWVEDCPHDNYNGAPRDGSAWRSGDCSKRVVRGGSWLSGPEALRSAHRDRDAAASGASSIGFRVGRTLTP